MAPRLFLVLRDQFARIPDFVQDLKGKTVVVVGANVGLGFEAAKKFASMNPKRLILACRNEAKGRDAARMIKEATACTSVECWIVDLANFKSISAFADKFQNEGGGHLDILLMNAGVLNSKFIPTVDNWESTLQVNHLGTALLTLLFLPMMASSPGAPRITIVSSDMHYWVNELPEAQSSNMLDALNDPTGLTTSNIIDRYKITKLFNVLFARALAARSKPNLSVSFDSVNPGFSYSSIRRSAPFPINILDSLVGFIFARTTETGARTLVHAALWGTKEQVNGKFLNTCRVELECDFAISKEGKAAEEKLWDETIEVLQKVDPRVEAIVEEFFQ